MEAKIGSNVYCNRVLIGNWYESSQLTEHKLNGFLEEMKSGKLMLAKFRKVESNLDAPAEVTQATTKVCFGDKVSLLAPHIPATSPPDAAHTGLLLGGRLGADDINYHQQLVDGCALAAFTRKSPSGRSAFVLTSADYCDRRDEPLKYNQEFMLVLAASADDTPLYVRYDTDSVPGINGVYPVYLSEHAVTAARWRVLPVMRPGVTRFEQEGQNVPVNEDVVINHCSTNRNLGVNTEKWTMGFKGKICTLMVKTCLDVHRRELPNNIWQIYAPTQK